MGARTWRSCCASPPRRAASTARNSTLLSAGLPGAGWWVAGAAVAVAEDADVELDEVERFCTEHGLWPGMPSGLPARRALGIGVSERRDDLLCRRQPAAQCMPPAGRASGPTTRAARGCGHLAEATHRTPKATRPARREARTSKDMR